MYKETVSRIRDVEEKNLGQFPKNCHYALKNMGLGSEIRDPEKTYPGASGQKGTGYRIRIRSTKKG